MAYKKNTTEYEYTVVREIGTLESGARVELGHYTVDGKEQSNKVYINTYYTDKNGKEQRSRGCLAKLSVADFLALQNIDAGDLADEVEETEGMFD